MQHDLINFWKISTCTVLWNFAIQLIFCLKIPICQWTALTNPANLLILENFPVCTRYIRVSTYLNIIWIFLHRPLIWIENRVKILILGRQRPKVTITARVYRLQRFGCICYQSDRKPNFSHTKHNLQQIWKHLLPIW